MDVTFRLVRTNEKATTTKTHERKVLRITGGLFFEWYLWTGAITICVFNDVLKMDFFSRENYLDRRNLIKTRNQILNECTWKKIEIRKFNQIFLFSLFSLCVFFLHFFHSACFLHCCNRSKKLKTPVDSKCMRYRVGGLAKSAVKR